MATNKKTIKPRAKAKPKAKVEDIKAVNPEIVEITMEYKVNDKPSPELKSSGIGDTIAKVTDILGIKKCDNCNKRQSTLNRLFPYMNLDRELTKEELELMRSINSTPGIIQHKDKVELFKTYNSLFNTKLEPCNCSGLVSNLIKRINAWIEPSER